MANRTARLPRLTDHIAEVTQQLITFDIRGVGFLLPIESAFKAIAFESLGHPLKQIDFGGDILPVVNVDRYIFNRIEETQHPPQQQIALIVQTDMGNHQDTNSLIVLPIDSAPALCRVTESSLVPLPRIYQVKCVDGMTNQTSDHPLRFLLNPAQLATHLPKLPATQKSHPPITATAIA